MSEATIDKRQLRRMKLLNDPIPKVVTEMAIPTIISSVIMSLYNMADTYFCSSLGTAATAAIGVNNSLLSLIQMFGMTLGVGANSFIARLLGAREDKKASQVFSTVFFTAIGFGVLVMIFGLTFMDQLVELLGARDDVKPYAIQYASYILYGAPYMTVVFVMNQCLRAEGSAAYSSFGMICGSILNCILDPIFIFTLDMGVAGAACATSIAKLCSFTVLFLPYIRKKTLARLSFRNIKYSKEIVGEVVKIGIPTLFRSALMSVSQIITNNVAAGFSTSALAAISVVNRIMAFVASAIMGFGHGYQTVAGMSWGAKKYARVQKAYKFAAICGTAIVSAVALIVFMIPKQLIGIFTEIDEEMIAIGTYTLRLRCAAMPLHALVMVSQSSFTALGKAKEAAMLSLSRQGFCLIPAVAILPRLFGIWGLGAAQPCADLISFFIAVPVTLKLMKRIKSMAEEFGDEQIKETPAEA